MHNITATITSQADSQLLDGEYSWIYERRFVGSSEWLKKYPEKEDEGHRDYLEYVSRAVPFTIKGGESIAKLIELEGNIIEAPKFPIVFQLILRAHSEKGVYSATARYACLRSPFSLEPPLTVIVMSQPKRPLFA